MLVVDDSYLTGAHEAAITNELTNVCSQVIYLYILDMHLCQTPDIEVKMNHCEVSLLVDLLSLLQEPDYVINSRVLKTIFSSSFDTFTDFISQVSVPQQLEIYQQGLAEGYAALGLQFSSKISYLQMHIIKRTTGTIAPFRVMG